MARHELKIKDFSGQVERELACSFGTGHDRRFLVVVELHSMRAWYRVTNGAAVVKETVNLGEAIDAYNALG